MIKPKISRKSAILLVLTAIIASLLFIPGFKSPSIVGMATSSSRVNILGSTYNMTCNVSLTEGWNLFSIPCEVSETNFSLFLSEQIGQNFTSIHSYNPHDTNDTWKSYNPSLYSWIEQDLYEFNNSRGYWIKMNNDSGISVYGILTIPRPVYLKTGWTLASYKHFQDRNTSQAIISFSNNFISIHSYNKTDEVWRSQVAGQENDSTLTYVTPNYGYWIKLETSDGWLVV